MKTALTRPAPSPEFQDSTLPRESSRSLSLLVREAAARFKLASADFPIARTVRCLGKGNGEMFHASRY